MLQAYHRKRSKVPLHVVQVTQLISSTLRPSRKESHFVRLVYEIIQLVSCRSKGRIFSMNLDLKVIVSLILVIPRLPSLLMAHFLLTIFDLIGDWFKKCTRALESHHRLRPSVFMLSYHLVPLSLTQYPVYFGLNWSLPVVQSSCQGCEAPFFHFSLGDPIQFDYPMPRKPRYPMVSTKPLPYFLIASSFSVFSFESQSFIDRAGKRTVILNDTFFFKLWPA